MQARPFPPSPRRRALARRAGLHAASAIVVGGVACAAALAASVVVARAGAARLGAWIAAACDGRATLALGDAARAVLELAAPVLAAAAVAAAAAHFAQTRALWLPRRRVDGAPAMRRPRAFELAAPVAIGATCIGWLWLVAPRLARASSVAHAGALLASFVATLACTWLAIGVVDALLRHAAHARALAMTAAEKREDERLAAADPRWRARVRDPMPTVAGAAVVIVGDGRAAAIAFDPVRRPVPARVAVGSGARATQLVALARRHHIPVHRDDALARALAAIEGTVPEAHWPRLAEIVGALRR